MGERISATSENLSRRGIFVRTSQFVPIGEVVELAIHCGDDGEAIPLVSRVVHVLSESAAATLGRRAGMGFEFLEQDPERLSALDRCVHRLISDDPVRRTSPAPRMRLVVAESSTRLLERVSSALSEVGFEVTMATTGPEAYAACAGAPHDLLLTADDLPFMDGWTLIRRLRAHPATSQIPIVMMSNESGDIARLGAYRLGVKDYILKPFTSEELTLRLRNAVSQPQRSAEYVVLRGKLAEIGLATLLSLFEFERKSGLLVLIADRELVTLFIAEGRIVKIDPIASGATSHDRLLELLDWKSGTFEFILSDVVGTDEVRMSITHILLEHARRKDESSR